MSREEFIETRLEIVDSVRDLALENITRARQKSTQNFDANRREHNFQIGNIVWRKSNALSNADKHFAASLAPKRDGPFRISRIIGKNTCMLEEMNGTPAGKRHVEDLKLYVGQPQWAD
jgi:hypothetical protein